MSAPDPARTTAAPRRGLALTTLFAIGALWGLTFSLARMVTAAGAHPFGLSLLHGLAGAGILLPYVLIRYRAIPLGAEYLRFYVIAGALGTALPTTVLFSAAAHVPAGVLAIIAAMVPLLIYAVALAFRIERYALRRSLGIVLGLAAVAMIALPETGLPDRAMTGWVLFALLVPACYAGENVFIALRRPAGSDSLVLLCGMQLAGAAMLTPLVWASGTWVSLALPWSEVEWWIVGLIIVNTSAYLMFIELIRVAGPVFAAQAGYLVTVSGVFWGMALLDERHSGWVWGAIAVTFMGLAPVNPRPLHARR